MFIRKDKCIVYDIEVFPNVFHCCCKDTETGKIYKYEISERKNQMEDLIDAFMMPDLIFCGYNNHHYDDVIINYIICYRNKLTGLSYQRICSHSGLLQVVPYAIVTVRQTPARISRSP